VRRSNWSAPPADRSPDRQGAGHLRLRPGQLVRQAQIDDGERAGLISDERARLGELERENARVPMERDLPKRTVAFWVTWTSTP
jgi:hypothetical protein